MQVWNALHAARCKYRTQKIAISAPSHNFVGLYLRNWGMYRQSEKNLLSSNMSSTCLHNMVNFGLLAAEIGLPVWGTPCKFHPVSRLGSVTCTASSSGRQPNFAALNRGRQLYSAGRPSRWALAHILVMVALCNRADHYIFALWFLSIYLLSSSIFFFSSPNLSRRRLDVYHTSTHGVALVRI